MNKEKITRVKHYIKTNARDLRNNMTNAELNLWRHLRMRQVSGFKFRRQHPCANYILDFACIEIKLAIELDGGQHQSHAEYDAMRTQWLNNQGWEVLRFWNNDVLNQLNSVLERINEHCKKHLPPS